VRDVAFYIEKIEPKIFYGGHSDNFNIGASPYYHMALKRQFEIFGIPEDERAEVRGFHDPYDYLRPGLATFEWNDPVWRQRPDDKDSYRCGPRRHHHQRY
jgi:hypothetical protein